MRKYYKYVDESWVQPTLLSNGILGGDDFACSASVNYGGYYPWKVFDKAPNDGTNGWESYSTNPWFIFYNPDPLKVTQIRIQNFNTNMSNYWTKSGDIYGSNDGENWTSEPIKSFTNSNNTANEWWTIDLSSNTGYYKYYKFTNLTYSAYILWVEMKITAVYKDSIEATESDYDYYKDVDVYKLPNPIVRKYYKYTENSWTRPNLTSNGTLGEDKFAVSATVNTSGYEAYKAVDGNTSTYYDSTSKNTGDYVFYNPDPLKCTKLVFTNYDGNYNLSACVLYGSDDNVNYTQLTTTFTTSGSNQTVTISNPTFYKYYKIHYTKGTYTWSLREIAITATVRGSVESTVSDYDFYKDVNICEVAKTVQRNYYKYQYQTMPQPLIYTDGTIGVDEFAVWHKGTSTTGHGYEAFDGDSTTRTYMPYTENADPIQMIFYHDKPWCLTQLSTVTYSNYTWYKASLYGSNHPIDNDTLEGWTFIQRFEIADPTNGFTININNSNYYKYYGFGKMNGATYRQVWEAYSITLTATEQIIVPATSSNYDFYKDENTYKALKY